MRICIFSRPFFPAIGGLERMAMTLATEFASAGHQVEVVTDTPQSSMGHEIALFDVTRTTSAWLRYCAFRRADVILLMNVSLHGVPLAVLARRPVVISHQGIYGTRRFGRITYLRERLKHHITRIFTNVACSHYVASHLPTISTVIPNAYDDTLFTVDSNFSKKRDFVFCGRLVTDKGVDIALSAFAQVLHLYPKSTFTVIGEGPEREKIQAVVRQLGCAEAVEFAGTLRGTELRDALRAHRCMVVPSLWEEPFGIVALEGIACCGRAIVSRRGGLPQAVGECGTVTDPTVEDFRSAMSAELERLKTLTEAKRELFERQRIAHLAVHQARPIATRYLEVLVDVLRGA